MARRKKIVLGAAKVAKVFRELPRENIKRITHALNLGADEIVTIAKLIAVKSDPIAGEFHYADSIRKGRIKARAATERLSERVTIAVFAGGINEEITDAAFRSEYGRKPGGKTKGGGEHPGHAAQPALYPAYFSIRKRVRSRVKREVNRAAKAVAARNK